MDHTISRHRSRNADLGVAAHRLNRTWRYSSQTLSDSSAHPDLYLLPVGVSEAQNSIAGVRFPLANARLDEVKGVLQSVS